MISVLPVAVLQMVAPMPSIRLRHVSGGWRWVWLCLLVVGWTTGAVRAHEEVVAAVNVPTSTFGLEVTVAPEVVSRSGRVVDRFGRPIPEVQVRLGEIELVASDEAGVFVLEVRPEDLSGRPVVVFEHPEFLPLAIAWDRLGEGDLVLTHLGQVSETVLVAGEPLGDKFSPHSVVSSIVEIADRVIAVGSLGEAASGVVGVSENGQGGLFQVLSIRGTSRQRVLALLAGARLTSERRAGVSASFIDPQLLGAVEVVRGPASTYYGAGALGGAFLISPRRFDRGEVYLEYGSEGDANAQVMGWGNEDWSFGLARRASSDGKTPSGLRLFDRYEQVSATIARDWQGLGKDWNLMVLPSAGSDIGKPNSDFPDRQTLYPRERHLVVRLGVEDPNSKWSSSGWVHTQELVTQVDTPLVSRALVESSSFDLGGSWQLRLDPGPRVSGRVGVEYFGRRGVRIREESHDSVNGDFLSAGERTASLRDAESDEVGALGVLNGTLGKVRWEAGSRLTVHRQDDRGTEQITREAVTGFIGAALPLSQRVELVANLGRGVRMPTLSERFFVGTTGRGQTIGEPDLRPESSLNAELGLRVGLPKGYLLLQAFRNEVDDYIERLEIGGDRRSFRNLTSGRLSGVEAEASIQLSSIWSVGFGGQWLEGKGDDGAPLADVPQAELHGSLTLDRGPWSASLRLDWRDEKSDPGPGEVAIADALLADAGAEVTLKSGIAVFVSVKNLLDEDYFPTADDKAVPARRRSLVLGLRLGLGQGAKGAASPASSN